MGSPYVAETPFRPQRPLALAIYCSDGRFTEAVEELATERGHVAVDTLTLPGGPGLFDYSASYSARDAITRATGFLIRRHALRRVLLIAHEECGYYADRFSRATNAERERRQLGDLRGAAREIRRMKAGLVIEAYFARIGGERVAFEPVELA